MRRWSVGAHGPTNYLWHPIWKPPVPAALLLAAYAATFVLFLVWLLTEEREPAG